jgi:hypothetical protein
MPRTSVSAGPSASLQQVRPWAWCNTCRNLRRPRFQWRRLALTRPLRRRPGMTTFHLLPQQCCPRRRWQRNLRQPLRLLRMSPKQRKRRRHLLAAAKITSHRWVAPRQRMPRTRLQIMRPVWVRPMRSCHGTCMRAWRRRNRRFLAAVDAARIRRARLHLYAPVARLIFF